MALCLHSPGGRPSVSANYLTRDAKPNTRQRIKVTVQTHQLDSNIADISSSLPESAEKGNKKLRQSKQQTFT